MQKNIFYMVIALCIIIAVEQQGSADESLLNPQSLVTISLDKVSYNMDEQISATIINKTGKDIWLSPVCNFVAFSFLMKKTDSEWKIFDAYPTKDCAVPSLIKISSDQPLHQSVDLKIYERGGSDPFKIEPGTYKLVANYTDLSPEEQLRAKFEYIGAESNEFPIIAAKEK